MRKYRTNQNPLLEGIYKASQCTDIRDVEQALEDLEKVKKDLKNVRLESRAIFIREASLKKKYKKFFI